MTHLAIGDFTFQGVYLQALKNKYPHINLDIWIDDCRESSKDWHKGRNDALGQWLDSVDFIDNVYPIALNNYERSELIERARQKNYDIIVFIATQRSELYAKYAREISKTATIVGSKSKRFSKWFRKSFYFRKLNGYFDLERLERGSNQHISHIYRRRFEQCFGHLPLPDRCRGVMSISLSDNLIAQANQTLKNWVGEKATEHHPFVFVNHLSTTPKRDYSWEKLISVIVRLNQQFPELNFVLNVPPNAYAQVQQELQNEVRLSKIAVFLFTAEAHFLELPALIQTCDYVISVETATMHLSAALNKKLIALMREKSKRWNPTLAEKILYGERHVNDIPVTDVVNAFKSVYAKDNQSDL